MAKTIPHVKMTRAKGKRYYYFDTGQADEKGKRIWKRLPDLNDKTFGAVYGAMMGHRTKRAKASTLLTVAGLIDLYQASVDYRDKAESTKKIYTIYHRQLVDQVGNAPASELERKDVQLLVDKMGDRPGAANMIIGAGGAAFAWATSRGYVKFNPFDNIKKNKLGEHAPWPETLIELALASDDDLVRLSVHLLYFTAQRIGDVASMRWRDLEVGYIPVKQEKTDNELQIPIHSRLKAELARHRRSLTTIIPGKVGKAKTDAIRKALQDFASDKGYKVVPHGLRKNAVITLLEVGCSVAETASISGQSLQMVEHYAKRRSQGKLGKAAMLKWDV